MQHIGQILCCSVGIRRRRFRIYQGPGPGGWGAVTAGPPAVCSGLQDTELSWVLWESMEKQCARRAGALPARSSRVEEGTGRRGECYCRAEFLAVMVGLASRETRKWGEGTHVC